MTAGRAEVLRLEAEAWKKGFKMFKIGCGEVLADAWTLRFSAPLGDELSTKLAKVENVRVLRLALSLVMKATDAATATREVEELLARY